MKLTASCFIFTRRRFPRHYIGTTHLSLSTFPRCSFCSHTRTHCAAPPTILPLSLAFCVSTLHTFPSSPHFKSVVGTSQPKRNLPPPLFPAVEPPMSGKLFRCSWIS
eukprot:324876-Rhodomonas_salina.3